MRNRNFHSQLLKKSKKYRNVYKKYFAFLIVTILFGSVALALFLNCGFTYFEAKNLNKNNNINTKLNNIKLHKKYCNNPIVKTNLHGKILNSNNNNSTDFFTFGEKEYDNKKYYTKLDCSKYNIKKLNEFNTNDNIINYINNKNKDDNNVYIYNAIGGFTSLILFIVFLIFLLKYDKKRKKIIADFKNKLKDEQNEIKKLEKKLLNTYNKKEKKKILKKLYELKNCYNLKKKRKKK